MPYAGRLGATEMRRKVRHGFCDPHDQTRLTSNSGIVTRNSHAHAQSIHKAAPAPTAYARAYARESYSARGGTRAAAAL